MTEKSRDEQARKNCEACKRLFGDYVHSCHEFYRGWDAALAAQTVPGDVLKEMTERFLTWPLPASVCSDNCATMPNYPHRSGTTLLTADEARQMLEYVVGSALTAYGNARAAEAFKEAAQVATDHAMENGPTHDFTMGGHKIAEKICALKAAKGVK